MRKLSFVIPCYNSEGTIKIVVAEIVQTVLSMKDTDYEIILVNDCSKDNTFKVIKEICAGNNKIKGINLSKNYGQPSATIAGFAATSGEIVIYSDDDGQTPISELSKLIDKIDEGYDLVFAKFDSKKNSIFQNFGSKINDLMAVYLLDKPKGLHMGNFWICKQFVVREIIKCKNPFPYLIGLVLGITRNMAAVPTSHRPRIAGKSNYTLFKMLNLWLNGFTAFSVKPLRIASIFGFFTAFVGFLFILVIIYNKIFNPHILAGYSSIMATILFVGGMIMMMLGLVGEYLGRVYININNSSQYVIKETINID